MKKFDELLNEAKIRKIKIPKKFSTLKKKIIKDDPWRAGEKLANAVEKDWNEINKLVGDNSTGDDFNSAMSKLPAIVSFGDNMNLSTYHIASTISKKYF